jgi:hypothetical protein
VELYNLLTKYYSDDQINKKKNEAGSACNTYERQERGIQVFGWTPDGKRPYGRPRCRWETNNKMDL